MTCAAPFRLAGALAAAALATTPAQARLADAPFLHCRSGPSTGYNITARPVPLEPVEFFLTQRSSDRDPATFASITASGPGPREWAYWDGRQKNWYTMCLKQCRRTGSSIEATLIEYSYAHRLTVDFETGKFNYRRLLHQYSATWEGICEPRVAVEPPAQQFGYISEGAYEE